MNWTQIFNASKMFLTKNSPYILTGAGAVAVTAGSVVLAKKAKNSKDTVDVIENDKIVELHNHLDSVDISEKDMKKTLAKAYVRRAFSYARYYAAPVLLITGGIMCMVSATLIQTKRLKIMSASYTAMAAAFNEYRERVKKVVGEEKEKDIFDGIERDENGNVVKVGKPVTSAYSENTQTFSRLFGDGESRYWEKESSLNVLFITGAEANLNAKLRSKGFVTLNEVWQELGFTNFTEEGMYLGWRYIYKDPNYGSTYITLGLSGPKNSDKRAELSRSWREEIWIDLIPPHSLIGKIPKEKPVSVEEKKRIKSMRYRMGLNNE